MPENRLFIYHIKNTFEQGKENYVMAWLGEMDPAKRFRPADVSSNIANCRRDILSQLRELNKGYMTLDLLRDNVGKRLKTHLGLNKLFTSLQRFEDKEISIITNDVQIPWEWVYFEEKGKFLCELFPYGKEFLERIESISPPKEEPSEVIPKLADQLKKSYVLILYDTGGSRGLASLPSVRVEIKDLQILLEETGIPKKNILTIDGGKKDAESSFMDIITKGAENLKIIHYAGHIMRNSLYMTSGEIECKEIEDATAHKKLSAPLVFLNGCFSADILEEWEQEKNLSTSFLMAGASGCICTRRDIGDTVASDFSRKFYETLLSKDNSAPTRIGSVLQSARQEFKKGCSENDFGWLLYTLHGSPSYELFPRLDLSAVTKQVPSRSSVEKISKFAV